MILFFQTGMTDGNFFLQNISLNPEIYVQYNNGFVWILIEVCVCVAFVEHFIFILKTRALTFSLILWEIPLKLFT